MIVAGDSTWDWVSGLCYHEGQVSIYGPVAARVCYLQRPGRHPGSGLLPQDMFMSKCSAELAHTSPGCHGVSGTGDMRSGELIQFLASCSSQKAQSCKLQELGVS